MEATPPAFGPERIDDLVAELLRQGPREAAELIARETPALAAEALRRSNPVTIQAILEEVTEETRRAIVAAAPPGVGRQWVLNRDYPETAVGRLMNAPPFVCSPGTTVAEATEQLRDVARRAFVTYGFVIDDEGVLLGVLVLRELILADPAETVERLMLAQPFFLAPEMTFLEAMQAVITRSYPEYPVCDERGRLLGVVRGGRLFEQQAIQISAQAGSMVGVDSEERIVTPWSRSFRFRHPWLQLNLLTAFVAAGVVGVFQDVIDRVVLLAVFLPVLAGQSGNTGCQALAVTLRGMTLGHLEPGMLPRVVVKETLLGALNGLLVGLTAGIGMFAIAFVQHEGDPLRLAAIVIASMTGACAVSGASGAVIPIVLRRLGADPATASSIFLTTATDVVSMGLFLALATLLM